MVYSDDAFVTMLLTMALSPNREEYARPYSTSEMKKLEERVRDVGLLHIGKLMNVDISGLMIKLGISEEEAYRIYTLLNRSVQFSYSMDNFLRQGIEIVSCYNEEYPRRAIQRMKDAAPPTFYLCGAHELLSRPMLGIVGISGIKTTPEVRDYIEMLVRNATRLGYTLLTGGEPGVSRIALNLAMEHNGTIVELLGGDMLSHIHEDGIAEMIAMNRAAVLSPEHPEALFTVSHAITRNKFLFSLAEAVFVFNTDGKRGEIDALRNRYCDWVYALPSCAANDRLLSRGAIAAPAGIDLNFEALSEHWKTGQAEQLSLFDML